MNIPHDHRSLKRIPLFHRTREITGLGHHQKTEASEAPSCSPL
jgi:hypothetical protein